ncbi:thiol reductant ABC exporter subunit CydC [Caldalkalibacillus thermarum]|uniref:thiol reductant ABC exporter subunit CydC n=1 Tax=Caldalkalibacillus thermarum TaxID=296745 RepID=UPI001663189D|nr:thiol reductant ABC exporter subunit CydC [Caldalkalibacillus thermarum]GGK27000.1 thiol reductant ABC exporter subunit CydC [Caldalkalibacillus thermarum]
MRDLQPVLRHIWQEKRDVLLTVLFGWVTGLAAVGLFTASGYLISQAALSVPVYALMVVIASVKLLGFIRAIARYLERYVSHRATFTILSRIRTHFFAQLERLSPVRLQRLRSGDLLSRVVTDVEALQHFFLRIFYPPVVLVLIFLATVSFTLYFSWWLALLLLVGLIMTTVILPALFHVLRQKREQTALEQQSQLSAEATELLFGFQELKIYRQLAEKERQFKQANDTLIQTQAQIQKHELLQQVADKWVGMVTGFAVLAVGGWLITNGQLEGVYLAMFLLLTLTLFEHTAPMAAFPNYFRENKEAARRVFSIGQQKEEERKQEEETCKPDNVVQVSQPAHVSLEGPVAIRFEAVSFTYPGEGRPALNNVTFEVPAGSKTAIVGASGSGKSTVLHLILGLEQASSGQILLNDIPIDQLQPEVIWQKTNAVLQEQHFFSGTIRDNLLADVEDDKLIAALRQAGLDTFSLDQPVFDQGANLSGGEKQRLSIARVLLRQGQLWLLDEPFSSLDYPRAQKLMAQLLDAARDQTFIYVSHHLSNLDMMDQIVVMDEGSVQEQGTYAQLMNKRGMFYRLKQVEQDALNDR